MDDKLKRIEDKLDRVRDKISDIDVTLAAQHESLKLHIKRTDLLEKKLEPVEKHVIMVNGVLKFIGLVSIIAAIAESIVRVRNG